MNTYLIENTISGIILGAYVAIDEDAAWEACAADAGHSGRRDNAIDITEVAMDIHSHRTGDVLRRASATEAARYLNELGQDALEWADAGAISGDAYGYSEPVYMA